MSRVEENEKMIDRLTKIDFCSADAAMLAAVLADISKSLAVIADCCLDKWQKDQVDRLEKVFTKDEIIAMLTDMQMEIEENVLADDPNILLPFLQARETCIAIIQQKINALKEDNDGN